MQGRTSTATLLLLAWFTATCLVHDVRCQDTPTRIPSFKALMANSAVQTIIEIPNEAQSDILKNVKVSTDGIQLAIQAVLAKDTSKMLKGIGDAVSVLPGAFGFAGIAFSVAASVFAVLGGGGKKEDAVLAALGNLHASFDAEMAAIQTTLKTVNDKVELILSGIDQILSGISDIPAKVIAEMKMTDVTTMKDKFANVQRAAQEYASGNLTREQMVSKCDDFSVAALFSELETVLRDERDLFLARFGAQDHANGLVQVQLLAFYLSAIPLVTNCNALKYSIESLRADGERIDDLIKFAYSRAVWMLAEPDRTIHVRETFSPFGTAIDANGYQAQDGWTLSLSFKAYSFAPPHAACFGIVGDGRRLSSRPMGPAARAPDASTFCMKSVPTDDAPTRIVYSERVTGDGNTVAILQPEIRADFDRLDERGWTKTILPMYAAKASHWTRLPRLRLISDLLVLQAKTAKVSVDEISGQCRALGDGYDRDGDAHSKEYGSAPWTIFCVRYVTVSLREVDTKTSRFLADIQFNDMDAKAARTATCPNDGYARDAGSVTIPSQIKKHFFGGASTVRAFVVCLKWASMASSSTPSQFVERVWLDDGLPMADKPRQSRHVGGQPMTLPAPPPAAAFDAF